MGFFCWNNFHRPEYESLRMVSHVRRAAIIYRAAWSA
jgi:hypothetical protein